MVRLVNSTSLSALTALLLCSCASVSDMTSEAETMARSDVPLEQDSFRGDASGIGSIEDGWLAKIDDPVLTGLVTEALANNRDLSAAASRVEEAWALAGKAGSALSPQVSAGIQTSGQGTGTSEPQGSTGLGVQASWEIDLWGRLRSGANAASQDAAAAALDFQYAQQSLAAAVARAYFFAVEGNIREQIAIDSETALKDVVRIVTAQKNEGLATAQDLALANTDLGQIEDTRIAAGGAKRDALRALELLLGRYPGAELDVAKQLPPPPALPPAGLPSEMLERRPDLVAAERRLAASLGRVNEAKAARLPSLSLTGSAGGSSTELSSLLSPANVAWQAASSLIAPVIDGGRRQRDVEIANARQQAALDEYVAAALSAFGETETGLDQNKVLAERETVLTTSSTNAAEAYRLARLNYESGETGLLEVQEIQLRKLEADNLLAAVSRGRLVQFVDLNLALGGTWEGVATNGL
ncbi:MAG: TolC family protein [Pseudomonadota bacterium]